ncbi:Wadjet anti-phage system protein JetD domain-containing protein [Modicisalibacter coralii]|uniref:Wadjet anti-phage system protein JetD domain-containing protein n=1 Tax=Modicisalibacter coralii TaxID=2304602 RepID=UPI00100A8FC8|nr:Wadjet anti-phage system protein JetD domain-containing protein [Halomonas coralii]
MSHLSERAEAVKTRLEGEWSRHRQRGRLKRWNSSTLARNLKHEGPCETEFEAWQVLAELAAAGIVEAPAASLRHQVSLTLGLSEAVRHRLASEAVPVDASLGLDAGQAAAWRHALAEGLEEWSLADQRRLAEGLRALAAALPDAYATSAFTASARYLLGSSKLLDALPAPLVRAFGIDRGAFSESCSWVLASVPTHPEGLLLIENPQSFEQACRVGVGDRQALICSFGYGLSLARALAEPERVRLIGERASRCSLAELMALPTATFWGDLDPEGLRQFRRLRASLPGLRLSALYAPMAAAEGHPLHVLTGKGGQRPGGDWARGVDQEAIDDATLLELAGGALDEARERRWLAALDAPPGPSAFG